MKWMHSRKQEGTQEEDLEECLQRHKAKWEQTARKTEGVVVITTRQHERGNIWNNCGSLLNLSQENGWAKDKEGMANIWIEKK